MPLSPSSSNPARLPLFHSLIESIGDARAAARECVQAFEQRDAAMSMHRSELRQAEQGAEAAMKAFQAITQLPSPQVAPRADLDTGDAVDQARDELASLQVARSALEALAVAIPRFVDLNRRVGETTDHPKFAAWHRDASQALVQLTLALADGDSAALTSAGDELEQWLSRRASVVTEVEQEYARAKSAAENLVFAIGRAEAKVSTMRSANEQARGKAVAASFGAAATGAGLACLPGSCYGAFTTGQTAAGSGMAAAVTAGVLVWMIALLVNTGGGASAKTSQDLEGAEGELAEARRAHREAQELLHVLEQQRKVIVG